MSGCPWPGFPPSVFTKLIKAFNGSGKCLNSEHTSSLWSSVLTPVDLWSFCGRPRTYEHLSLLAPSHSPLRHFTASRIPACVPGNLSHLLHPLPWCRWPVSGPVTPHHQCLFPLQPVHPWEGQSLTVFPVASETNTGSTKCLLEDPTLV